MAHNSRLNTLILSFSKTEANQFESFLASPFHNKRPIMEELFQLLLSTIKSDASHFLDRAALWEELCPGKPFRDLKMRHLMSELYALAKDFLAWKALENAPAQKQLLIGGAFMEKGLNDLFQVEQNKARRTFQSRTHLEGNDDWYQFQWAQKASQLYVGLGREEEEEIFQHYAGMDEWFLLQKLRQACSYLSHSKLLESGQSPLSKIPFLASALELVQTKDLSQNPLLDLYYAAYRLLTEGKEPPFLRLLERLETYYQQLPKSDVRSFYMLAINFCIKKLNDGQEEYLSQLYQLYQNGLDREWLIEQGELSPWAFKNVVSVGLKLNEFERVAAFIETYKSRLPASHKYDFSQHAYAELYFAQKDFRNVLKTIRFVHIKDRITHSRLRMIRIKACFELQEWELLDAQLENFQAFLRRAKYSTYHQSRYKQFIRMVNRLVNLPPGPSTERVALTEECESIPDLLEKKWLIEKCVL